MEFLFLYMELPGELEFWIIGYRKQNLLRIRCRSLSCYLVYLALLSYPSMFISACNGMIAAASRN